MNFLTNMRISHKISALMVGLVFGFIIIGITYYIQINIDKSNNTKKQLNFDYQTQLTKLNLLQYQLQASAIQFLTTKSTNSLALHESLLSNLNTSLNDALSTAVDRQVRDELEKVKAAISKYSEVFNESKTALETYGLSVNEGLRGQLTLAATNIENILENNQGTTSIPAFLTLRRVENDYLISGNEKHIVDFGEQFSTFEDTLVNISLSSADDQLLLINVDNYRQSFNGIIQNFEETNILKDKLASIEFDISNAFSNAIMASSSASEQLLKETNKHTQAGQAAVTAIIFIVAMGTAIGIYLIYKSIVFPMTHMQGVIQKINRGKTNTRVKLIGNDELGDLGTAFNKLLDERIQQLEEQSKENERLNNSIISLIRALGMIAKKDLTIKVPVSSDITGTISDAVNLLTSETSKTLQEVKDISEQVHDLSDLLQNQSNLVMQFADNERRQIIATSKALDVLARAMGDVASRSENADKSASIAIENTQSARETVVETVSGIRTIRETIAEAEKRMKRLGDRSQEVSGIVSLINTIAERTHILALNASMHAASAGEAGKGFAVVADEVQRLAESARESTDEIASMVNNMRVETSDTVNIMNTLITQVAEGSRLAEQAGERMEATESATEELVETVKRIAEQATQQAEVANRVRDRATIIKNFTEKTGKQLLEQNKHTENLKTCSDTLVERVNVFVLPEAERTQIFVEKDKQKEKAIEEEKKIAHLQTAS